MEFLGIIFQAIAYLLAILAAAILIWVNQEKSHSNRMLALVLLVLSLLNFNGVFFHMGWYLQFPWLHKIAIPFSLLITPVAYIYVRSVLLGEVRFRKYDWLLLLPALLFAINLIPYYTMPVGEKKAYLAEYYKKSSLRTSDSEGILPAYIFAFFRIVWSILFVAVNYRLIRRFKKQATKKVLTDNGALLNWLTQFNGLLAGLLAAGLFVAIIAPIKKTGFNVLDLALGTIVLIICLQLFIRPKILYGIFQPTQLEPEPQALILPEEIPATEFPIIEGNENTTTIDEKTSPIIISQSDALRYKRSIEKFFHEHQPFLQTDYSLEQLVADVGIQRYLLSTFINREYGMGFREFINRRRVDYLIANIDKPEWKQFTLDAIASECGFHSRITFFRSFKQITGQTPSEFMKALPKKTGS